MRDHRILLGIWIRHQYAALKTILLKPIYIRENEKMAYLSGVCTFLVEYIDHLWHVHNHLRKNSHECIHHRNWMWRNRLLWMGIVVRIWDHMWDTFHFLDMLNRYLKWSISRQIDRTIRRQDGLAPYPFFISWTWMILNRKNKTAYPILVRLITRRKSSQPNEILTPTKLISTSKIGKVHFQMYSLKTNKNACIATAVPESLKSIFANASGSKPSTVFHAFRKAFKEIQKYPNDDGMISIE